MPRWLPTAISAGSFVVLALTQRLDGFALSAASATMLAFPLVLLMDEDVPAWLRWVACAAGLAGGGTLALPVGSNAGLLATAWALATVPHGAYGFVRFLSNPEPRRVCAWAEVAASVGPLVSTVALMTSRSTASFAGFPEPLATLTVTHFSYTFGVMPLALSALARRGFAAERPLWGLVFIPPVIGSLMALRVEVLSPSFAEGCVAMGLAACALWWAVESWPRWSALPRAPRWIGRVASGLFASAVGLTPAFALSWALGAPRLDFAAMLRDHGLSLGTALLTLGVLTARLAPVQGVTGTLPLPNLTAPTRDVEESRAFFVDCRVADLGSAGEGRFERIADALLAYQFYPSHVMLSDSGFQAQNRPAAVGDRIGMVLLVPLFPGLPAIRFPATTEVNLAERVSDRAAFGYLTTEAHYGAGAWSATIEKVEGRIRLTLRSRMRPTHPLALLGLPVYRWFQKRAHGAGIRALGGRP